MPPRSTRKRGATSIAAPEQVPAAASATPAAKKQRKAKEAVGSMKEDDASGIEAQNAQAFWEKFHTELIRSWFMDHDGWKKISPTAGYLDRVLLIETVVGARVPRPKGKFDEQRKAMQDCWRKRHRGREDSVPSEWPDPHVRPGSRKSISAPLSPATGSKPPVKESAEEATTISDEEEGDEDEDRAPPSAAATVSAAPPKQTIYTDLRDWEDGCQACTLVPPSSDVSKKGTWLCKSCNIRGDLHPADPINVFMREQLKLKADKLEKQPAPPSSHGQTLTTSTDALPADKLEKHLLALSTALGDPHPLFLPSAAAPTPQQAIDTARLALGASGTAAPPLSCSA